MTLSVNACATSITAINKECLWAEIIRPSRQDVLTLGTEDQIFLHNKNVEDNCKPKSEGN